MKQALEEAQRREVSVQQQVQEAQQRLQQVQEQHQSQIKAKDEELQHIKEHNEKLIKEKEHITQQHVQEAYQTNMSLHRRTMELEKALQEAKTLLRERTQQVHELEEVSKIPISLDDQLKTEHRLVMQDS